jgi:hypothetical protein
MNTNKLEELLAHYTNAIYSWFYASPVERDRWNEYINKFHKQILRAFKKAKRKGKKRYEIT